MPISQSELTSIKTCLDILDGLTKAFDHLDKMFDELTAAHEETIEDSKRYVQHSELISDLHGLVVNDLTELRDNLFCQCNGETTDRCNCDD